MSNGDLLLTDLASMKFENDIRVRAGQCSVCGRTFEIRKDGKMPRHRRPQMPAPLRRTRRPLCAGANQPPKEVDRS